MKLEEFVGLNAGELKTWLFLAFDSNDFSPLEIFQEPNISTQIKLFAEKRGVEFSERLKAAVAEGLSEWQPRHGGACLRFFLETIAQFKVTSAANSVFFLLKKRRLEDTVCDGVWLPSLAMGVLSGLAAGPGVVEKLEGLLGQAGIPKILHPQAIIGICRVAPERFYSLAEKLLDALDSNPDFFSVPLILGAILDELTPQCFEDAFNLLPEPVRARFFMVLRAESGNLFNLLWNSSVPYLFYRDRSYRLGSQKELGELRTYYDQMRNVTVRDLDALLN